MALEPARIITAASPMPTPASRSPMPRSGLVHQGEPGTATHDFETDAEGRFRANPLPADRYAVSGLRSRGAALSERRSESFDWPKGAVEHSVDLALPRAW